jgi:hypothetical protein
VGCPNFGNTRLNAGLVGRNRFEKLELLSHQMAIYQAIECSLPFHSREMVWRTRIFESFKREFLVPIAEQNHLSIHASDDSIDYVGCFESWRAD